MPRWPAAAVWLSVIAAAAGCGAPSSTTSGAATIPRRLLLEARPIGRGPRFQPPVRGPVVGLCRPVLGPRFGVHVEVFGAGRVVLVPAGIGARPPLSLSAGRVSRARCFGSVVTVDPTGLLLVRPNARLTLSALFRAWGQPLSRRRVGAFRAGPPGVVAVFVNGRRWRGRPGDVPLVRHAEIVVEAGPHVPPHSAYTFPLGL